MALGQVSRARATAAFYYADGHGRKVWRNRATCFSADLDEAC